MSIELTEKDIKAIARERARPSNRTGWLVIGVVSAWILSIVAVFLVLGPGWTLAVPQWSASDTVVGVGGIIVLGVLIPIGVAWDLRERRIFKQLKQEHGE